MIRIRNTAGARSYEGLAAARKGVQEHQRVPEESGGEEGHPAFAVSYRLGASLLAGLRPTDHRLSPDLDTVAAGGHLLMACLEHASLSQPPTSALDFPSAAPSSFPTDASLALPAPSSLYCVLFLSPVTCAHVAACGSQARVLPVWGVCSLQAWVCDCARA